MSDKKVNKAKKIIEIMKIKTITATPKITKNSYFIKKIQLI